MATSRNGIMGGFSGKAGPVVGTTWKKTNVVKSSSKKTIRKEDLLPQSFAFKMMSEFLSCFTDDINLGFYHRKNKVSPFNKAMRINLNAAVIGESPDYEIDYENIIFSKGDLETAWIATATRIGETQININWEIPETLELKQVGNDAVRLLIYNATRKTAMSVNYAATRRDLSMDINFDPVFKDDQFHIWMYFISPDGKSVSDSDYVEFL